MSSMGCTLCPRWWCSWWTQMTQTHSCCSGRSCCREGWQRCRRGMMRHSGRCSGMFPTSMMCSWWRLLHCMRHTNHRRPHSGHWPDTRWQHTQTHRCPGAERTQRYMSNSWRRLCRCRWSRSCSMTCMMWSRWCHCMCPQSLAPGGSRPGSGSWHRRGRRRQSWRAQCIAWYCTRCLSCTW